MAELRNNEDFFEGVEFKDVKKMLEELGIKEDSCIVMHTSLKKIGGVKGGAEALLNALTDFLSEGLLVIPTHTWANVNKSAPEFDVRTTPPCIGVFPTYCAKQAFLRENALRSLHPTHSVAVFGKGAKKFAAGEINIRTRTAVDGIWGRLEKEGAKVLLVGVGLERNTYLHSVDEEVNALPQNEEYYFDPILTDENGEKHVLRHMNTHCYWDSEDFPKLEDFFEKSGALSFSRLGNAKVTCFDVKIGHDALVKLCEKSSDTTDFLSIVEAAL